MDTKEMTDMLVRSLESNNSRFIPWWEGDHEDSSYYYEMLKQEDVENVRECIASCDKAELFQPVGSMGVSIFHLLVWHNFYDDVKKLIDDGADVNIKAELGKGILKDVCVGATPLMFACYQGNYEMAKLLVEAGADTCASDEMGRNAYHYLASRINKLPRDYECLNHSLSQRKAIVDLLTDGVSQKDNDGKTAIEYMIEQNNNNVSCALAKALIDKGADTTMVNEEGDSLLIQALKNDHITAAIELAANKEIINLQDSEGKTALHHAAYRESLKLCMIMMEKGADKNIKDNNGLTALDMAENDDCEDIVKFLKTGRVDLDNLARITSNSFVGASDEEKDKMAIALYLAKKLINEVDTDDDDEMQKILRIMYNALGSDEECQVLDICEKAGIDFVQPIYNSGTVTCVRDDCLGGNYGVKVIKKFMEMGVDMETPVVKGKTPINIIAAQEERQMFSRKKDDYFEKAAEYFSAESMEQLDNEGISAVHYAARRNHSDMLKVMIEKGIDVNVTEDEPACAGNTPLHEACDKGSKEAVEVLMEAGADDTLLNVKGSTPAHIVVTAKRFGQELEEEERIAILELLKNVDIPSNDGKTPLMVAQSLDLNTALSVTQLLIDKGADVNHTDNDGNTALILNTKNNCYKGTVKELIKAGADVNALDKLGNSALYYALKDGDQESARLMIKKGADYNHENNDGVTPLQVAVENGYDNVLELMI